MNKIKKIACLLTAACVLITNMAVTSLAIDTPLQPELHYDMSYSGTQLIDQSGNGHDGTLVKFTEENFIKTATADAVSFTGDNYVAIPSGVVSGNKLTVSTVAYSENGWWMYCFGKNNGQYTFMTPQTDGKVKFAIANNPTGEGWQGGNEKKAVSSAATNLKRYVVFTTVIDEGTLTLYIDGVQAAQTTGIAHKLSDIIPTTGTSGYIAKSLYSVDPNFKGRMVDFKVYNSALTAQEISELSADASSQVLGLIQDDIKTAMLGKNTAADNITENLRFPATVSGQAVTWTIENPAVIAADGTVIRPAYTEADVVTSVTALFTHNSTPYTLKISVTVKKQLDPDMLLEQDANALTIPNANDIRGNITLPGATANNAVITWASSKEAVVSTQVVANENYDPIPAGVVTRGEQDEIVTLTATLSLNGKERIKEIPLTVRAKAEVDELSAYMFTYFTGEGHSTGEQIYFASSKDGLLWDDLNSNKPVLTSTLGDKGVRDPYILRSPEGDKFYMIATDLRIDNGLGWTAAQQAGSKSIIVWESTDLVNWSDARMVQVARDDAGCTWAPEIVYDEKTGEYLVFWASRVGEDNFAKQRIYIAKTRDFYTFSEPQVYVDKAKDVIDSTIIEQDGMYYRFSKDEVNKNILVDACDQLLGKEFTPISAPNVEGIKWVEGPAIFKFNDRDEWCLLLDDFGGKGYFPLNSTDLASGEFRRLAETEYMMPTGPRHGTVMAVTQAEYDRLQEKWGAVEKAPDASDSLPAIEYTFDSAQDGKIADVSGNGNDASLFGKATVAEDAVKGSVLYLDGSSNTYMALPQGFFDGKNSVTVSMDVKSEMDSGAYFTFAIGQDSNKYVYVKTGKDTIRNSMTRKSWGSETTISQNVGTIKSQWINLTMVISPDSLTLYKDGQLLGTQPLVNLSISNFGSKLNAYFGKSFYGGDGYFKGYFDNVTVYNRALSAEEVAVAGTISEVPAITEPILTTVGLAPVLPKTVPVLYAGGSMGYAGVIWDAIDPASYAEIGTFTAKGRVVGTSLSVTVTVNVTDALPENPQIVINDQENIDGTKGTQVRVPVLLTAFPEGEYKSIEGVSAVPDALEVTGVTASDKLTGAEFDWNVDTEGKLRFAFLSTTKDSIVFDDAQGISELLTITYQLKNDMNKDDTIDLAISSVIVKGSDKDFVYDMSNSGASIGIGSAPEELTAVSTVLFTGDGSDIIPAGMKAVSVAFTGIDETRSVKLGDVQFYYNEHRSTAAGKPTYVGLVAEAVTSDELNNVSSYTITEDTVPALIFGNTDNVADINAQDALNILSVWLRKNEPTNPGFDLIAMNVNADAALNTSDVIAVVDYYVSGKAFAIAAK